MQAYVLDWASLLVRWLHLITGIAWIGASFYFVWLDNHLVPPVSDDERERGISGDLWSVHGGGFYHNRKYPLGPRGQPLTEDLHWFKWEAYTTWLSGMGLLALVYWTGASTYLVDPSVRDLSPTAAVAVSAGSLAIGWLVYDGLCRMLGRRESVLAACVLAYVALASFALFSLFGARAAFLHVGAMLGTIMVANVYFVIIPGQRRTVEAIRAGRSPDPRDGANGKQRSVHNTYFTLPVLFAMISPHYPMTYAGRYGWLSLVAIMAAGAMIRQFFVLRHKGLVRPALPAGAIALLGAVAFALAPAAPSASGPPVAFADVRAIIQTRCTVCHAAVPTQPGFAQPPKGVVLETPEQIVALAAKIHETAVVTRYMPIANMTRITDPERETLSRWFAQGAATR